MEKILVYCRVGSAEQVSAETPKEETEKIIADTSDEE